MSHSAVTLAGAMAPIRLFDEHDYFVFDPGFNIGLPSEVASAQSWSLAPRLLNDSVELLPRLVRLSDVSPSARQSTLEFISDCVRDETSIGFSALISSSLPGEVLADSLRSRAIVRSPGENRSVYFRFHDPRVLQQLRWILNPAQLRHLLKGIRRWTYVLQTEWLHLDVQMLAATTSEDQPHAMSREQFAQIERTAAVNAVTQLLFASQGPDAWLLGPKIDQAMERAVNQHAFTRHADLQAFALHAMTVHPSFDSDAQISAALRDRDKDESYEDVAAGIHPDHWRRLQTTRPALKEHAV
jgi:Domain of unknown function (DUF4123)